MKLDLRKHLPRLALTALAALLGSGVVLGIVQANVQEWAKSSGNDQYLVNYAGPAMTRLAETTSSMPFIFITTMILGGAIFLWADSFARRWLEWYAGHRGHAISVRSIDRKLASMTLFFFLVVAMILSGAWVLYERRNAPTDKQLVTSADTPKQPLSEEDRRFRYELRGFSLST